MGRCLQGLPVDLGDPQILAETFKLGGGGGGGGLNPVPSLWTWGEGEGRHLDSVESRSDTGLKYT